MEVKERIIKGADSLFMRYGIKSMTMDDIAKHLSVSKKTIYQSFKDKRELVLCVMHNHLTEQEVIINEISKNAINSIDELFQLSKHIKSVMMEMNPSLVLDIQKYYPDAWKSFQKHEKECILQTIVKNLNWGKEEGYFRDELNSEILARARVAQIEAGFDPLYFPSSKFSVLEVQLELFNHFIMGLVTKEGYQLFNKYLEENEK